jgi:hypothetical protein
MIRTRDLILYLLVLAFILLAALHTGLAGRAVGEINRILFLPESAVGELVAFAPNTTSGADRMEELRRRLAAGDGFIAEAPPEFISVDQRARAEQAATNSEALLGDRVVQWCSGPVASPALATWPMRGVFEMVEGQRIFTVAETETVTVGTTTETIATNRTAFSLPVRTVRSTFDTCLPDTLIGVSPNGLPLLNETASAFVGYGASAVVGYTRDGFTVYGPVPDSSALDTCGGQYVNGVYQYHIRASEPFILSCYAGVPIEI